MVLPPLEWRLLSGVSDDGEGDASVSCGGFYGH